jgi:hypothetical protein
LASVAAPASAVVDVAAAVVVAGLLGAADWVDDAKTTWRVQEKSLKGIDTARELIRIEEINICYFNERGNDSE